MEIIKEFPNFGRMIGKDDCTSSAVTSRIRGENLKNFRIRFVIKCFCRLVQKKNYIKHAQEMDCATELNVGR